MPYGRKTFNKKYNKKRVYRRRKPYKSRAKKTTIIRFGTHFPDRLKAIFKWSTTGTLTDAIKETQQLRPNSIYDPGSSVFSTQPPMRDILALAYGQYIVYKWGWHITFINNSTTENCIVSVNNSNESDAVPNDYTLYIAQKDVQYKLCNANIAGSHIAVIKGSTTLQKVTGRRALDADYNSNYDTNPSATYMNITSHNLDGGDAQNMRYVLTLYQYVASFNRLQLLDS